MTKTFDFKLEKFKFDSQNLELVDSNIFAKEQYPVVYFIFDEQKRIAYVGESTTVKSRLKSHLKNKDKKKLKYFYLISSEFFNKSAALDIESLLIQYIPPAMNFKLLNGNVGVVNHSYYQQPSYKKLFSRIWEVFKLENITTKSLLEVENTDLFKYSPYKSLTLDQFESIKLVIKALLGKEESIFIKGVAGTGKTIVGITLVKLLSCYHIYEEDEFNWEDSEFNELLLSLRQKFPKGLNVGFVVPMSSLRKTLSNVFGEIYGLRKNMVIGPSDVDKKDYDILIVDEAHRLQRRVAIPNYGTYDQVNKRLGFDKDKDQLDWILKCSKKRVLFYDSEQSIKPADVRLKKFKDLIHSSKTKEIQLQSQMRCVGGNGLINFVENLLSCNISHPYTSSKYELVLYEDMNEMVRDLREKEKEHKLCRMMSGYSWNWVSRHDDKPNYDVVIDGVELVWNRESKDWINSTTDVTEMGCIHTVQGYDLNFAGVIFGEEIDYCNKTKSIIINKENYFDTNGKSSVKSEEELKDYIIKIYKTLMFRGIKGTYVYVCNDNLRLYLKKFIPLNM